MFGNNNKKEEAKVETNEEKKAERPVRQIVIETDGDFVRIVSADVAGTLEFKAILNSLITFCDNQPPK